MIRALAWAFVLCALACLPASAQPIPATAPSTTSPSAPTAEPAPPPLPATLPVKLLRAPAVLPPAVAQRAEQFIAQLGSDDWKARNSAQQELTRIGPLIAPRLQQLLATTRDEEIRGRTEAALAAIEEQRHFGASPIYLDVHQQPLRDVIDEMLAQADAPGSWSADTILRGRTWPDVTLHTDGTGFWPIACQLQQQTGLPVGDWHARINSDWADPITAGGVNSIDGPFLVIAQQIEWMRSIDLRTGAVNAAPGQFGPMRMGGRGRGMNMPTGLFIECVMLAEPKLCQLQGMVAAQSAVHVTAAEDDLGNNLAADQNVRLYSITPGAQPAVIWAIRIEVASPATGAHHLKRLAGTFTLTVAQGSQEIAIDDPVHAQPVTRVIGGRQFVVHTLEKPGGPGGLYTLQVEVENHPAAEDWQFLQTMLGQPDLELQDADGQSRYQCLRTMANNSGATSFSRYQFTPIGRGGMRQFGDKDSAPVRLVWRVPTGSRPLEGHFEFHDLPLP
jgi:hypothetical protein